MTLDEILNIVSASHSDDWHKMETHTTHGWEYGTDTDGPYLRPISHHYVAVYKPDVDITLVFGASDGDSFDEPWVQNFPAPTATARLTCVRYRGVIVDESRSVLVDGGRYLLPMPEVDGNGGFFVNADAIPRARLMFDLYGSGGVHQTLDEALERAQLEVRA
ncbi:hypothetical protein Poly24_17230 [Rosistilla carotiformis]|uniref:Uncharacterized protein n=1 Tax=Rosistilla carotiformis TaxID=2528017 RepID=A0A518JR51_9BACT|nr:hypothetical protein [Rosistilla carotiformis]QDV68017.1 hypothetical protein Poly24_17230 [Rosistilla carotiformis]